NGAHPGLVRFVADIRDAVQLLFANELADPPEEIRLVDLIRDLVDDDRLPIALVEILDMGPRANDDAAAAGPIALAHAFEAIDDAARGEVRGGHDVAKLVD